MHDSFLSYSGYRWLWVSLVLLTGSINRNDYGADGFPGYVGPMIGLRIVAQMTRGPE